VGHDLALLWRMKKPLIGELWNISVVVLEFFRVSWFSFSVFLLRERCVCCCACEAWVIFVWRYTAGYIVSLSSNHQQLQKPICLFFSARQAHGAALASPSRKEQPSSLGGFGRVFHSASVVDLSQPEIDGKGIVSNIRMGLVTAQAGCLLHSVPRNWRLEAYFLNILKAAAFWGIVRIFM
jgi:hypothetical protein